MSSDPLPKCFEDINFPYDLTYAVRFPGLVLIHPLPSILELERANKTLDVLASHQTFPDEAAFESAVNRFLRNLFNKDNPIAALVLKGYERVLEVPRHQDGSAKVQWEDAFNLVTRLVGVKEWFDLPEAKLVRSMEAAAAATETTNVNLPGTDYVLERTTTPNHALIRKLPSDKDLLLYLIMEFKWGSLVVKEVSASLVLNALNWLRRAGLYQTLWYCHAAYSSCDRNK